MITWHIWQRHTPYSKPPTTENVCFKSETKIWWQSYRSLLTLLSLFLSLSFSHFLCSLISFSSLFLPSQAATGCHFPNVLLSIPSLISLFLTLSMSPAVVFLSDQSQVVASVSHVFHQGCTPQTPTHTHTYTHTHTHSLSFFHKRWRRNEQIHLRKERSNDKKKKKPENNSFG